MKIGIQGLKASYSDAAATKAFPGAEKLYGESFAAVFQALQAGEITQAFLPFENSTAGFIAENYQLLYDSGFQVVSETIHRVEHCLLAAKGTQLQDIKAAWSHPQALLQCSEFLGGSGIRSEPYFDTAGAARDQARLPGQAAIASEKAADEYGLEVVARGIANNSENFTRFFRIDREAALAERLLVDCEPSAMTGLLSDLASQAIRLIYVLPIKVAGSTWGHRYAVELEARLDYVATWKNLRARHRDIVILGSFKGQR